MFFYPILDMMYIFELYFCIFNYCTKMHLIIFVRWQFLAIFKNCEIIFAELYHIDRKQFRKFQWANKSPDNNVEKCIIVYFSFLIQFNVKDFVNTTLKIDADRKQFTKFQCANKSSPDNNVEKCTLCIFLFWYSLMWKVACIQSSNLPVWEKLGSNWLFGSFNEQMNFCRTKIFQTHQCLNWH